MVQEKIGYEEEQYDQNRTRTEQNGFKERSFQR